MFEKQLSTILDGVLTTQGGRGGLLFGADQVMYGVKECISFLLGPHNCVFTHGSSVFYSGHVISGVEPCHLRTRLTTSFALPFLAQPTSVPAFVTLSDKHDQTRSTKDVRIQISEERYFELATYWGRRTPRAWRKLLSEGWRKLCIVKKLVYNKWKERRLGQVDGRGN